MAGLRSTAGYLVDPYGRPLSNLRMCVTQNCNMDCFFCHREGEVDPDREMTEVEIGRMIGTASSLGFRQLKITGGEPLLRQDLCSIISAASGNMEEVSLTTNGLLLEKWAYDLAKAGLDRVNVSLHSLRRDRFRRITGVNGLKNVIGGIGSARDAGLNPVKVNFVVLHGINVDETDDMLSFAGRMGVNLQLIEYMPIGRAKEAEEYHAELEEIEADLKRRAEHSEFVYLNHRRRYSLECEGNAVRAEVVKPIDNHSFCANCSRLRITSDGKLKPCLLRNDNLVDLRPLLEGGASEDEIQEAFRIAVSRREPYWK